MPACNCRAQEHYLVTPDITVVSKAMGAAIRLLWRFGRDHGQDRPRPVDELANYRDIRRHGDFERYIEWQHHLQHAGPYFHPNMSRCSSPRRTPRRISARPWNKWKKEPESV